MSGSFFFCRAKGTDAPWSTINCIAVDQSEAGNFVWCAINCHDTQVKKNIIGFAHYFAIS